MRYLLVLLLAGCATYTKPGSTEADYNRDMARFYVQPPTLEPKVSTHIAEIVSLIARLFESRTATPKDARSHGERRARFHDDQ